MVKIDTNSKKINEALERGVEEIYPSKEKFAEKLNSGERIRLYLGVDPTGFDLHIGHSVQLRKLKQLQELGHEVILLIGDFTGLIGDPSGKDKVRNQLTREQVLANAKDYQRQASKILDFKGKNPVKLKYNSKWLAKLSFQDVVELASHFTVQQMLQRDMFKRRLKEGEEIYFHEFLYPLMQGYDSVAMDVDLEVGGSDQMFNMLAGRELMKDIKKKEKFVLTTKLLEDSKGVKIGKTAGNVIAINAEPNDLYGKIMTLGDDVITKTFELCTDVSMEEIKAMKAELESGENPRNLKARLAYEIVKQYNDEDAAKKAAQEFDKVFKEKDKPTDVPGVYLPDEQMDLPHILKVANLSASVSEGRRFVEQGGVKIDDIVEKDWKKKIKLKPGTILSRGKRHFRKILGYK